MPVLEEKIKTQALDFKTELRTLQEESQGKGDKLQERTEELEQKARKIQELEQVRNFFRCFSVCFNTAVSAVSNTAASTSSGCCFSVWFAV